MKNSKTVFRNVYVSVPIFVAFAAIVIHILLVTVVFRPVCLLCSSVICGVLTFFTWRIREEFPVSAKLITTGTLMFCSFFPFLLTDKIWLLFCVIWQFCLIAIALIFGFVLYKGRIKINMFVGQILYLSIYLLWRMRGYALVDNGKLAKSLLIFSAIIAVVVTLRFFWKNQRIAQRIAYFVVICYILFATLWCAAVHLNYALDTVAPHQYEAIIEEKIQTNKRTRFLVITRGDTFYIDVTDSDFKNFDEDDTYSVYRYQGAFGVPYYVSGRN